MSESVGTASQSLLKRREWDRARKRAKRQRSALRFGAKVDEGVVLKQLSTVVRRRRTLEVLLPRLLAYRDSIQVLEAKMRRELGLPIGATELDLELPSLPDAKAAVFGHEFDQAFVKGALRFQFLEAENGGQEADCKVVSTDARLNQSDGGRSSATIDTWIRGRIEALVPASPDAATFTEKFLQFSAPVYSGGAKPGEGIQTDQGVVAALAPRDRGDEPVQIIIGVPGAGKTHRALQMMSRGKGRIHAFSPTPGSRAQVRQLVDKLGLIDRVKVVEKIGDLRRRSRVLIDEASLVKPGILHHLRDATELYLAGDAGQSAAKPGESLLGALAALGAPLIELTESRRTSSPAIKLLGQFVSSTQKPFIPDIERVVPERAINLSKCQEGEDFQAICAEAAKHKNCIAIVWSERLQEQLAATGIQTYQGNLAQGSEAEHVIVHMPADWSDPAKVPAPPFISFLNGICRAKTGATIVASADFDAMFYSNSLLKQRANDLEKVVDLACEDPRRPHKTPLSRWSDDRWRLCKLALKTLDGGNMSADLIGDWLFAYQKSSPDHYCGAVQIGPGQLGVTDQMVLAHGFPWAECFEMTAGEDREIAERNMRRRLVARIVPDEPSSNLNFRNRIAGLAKLNGADS